MKSETSNAPAEDNFDEALSGYLSIASLSGTIVVPVAVCFDKGRIAAMNGLTLSANPYYSSSEPDEYSARLEGFHAQILEMNKPGGAFHSLRKDRSSIVCRQQILELELLGKSSGSLARQVYDMAQIGQPGF